MHDNQSNTENTNTYIQQLQLLQVFFYYFRTWDTPTPTWQMTSSKEKGFPNENCDIQVHSSLKRNHSDMTSSVYGGLKARQQKKAALKDSVLEGHDKNKDLQRLWPSQKWGRAGRLSGRGKQRRCIFHEMCFLAEVIQVKPDWLPLIPALATPPNQKSHRTATIWVQQLPALSFRSTQHKGTTHSFVEIKTPVHASNQLLLHFFLHADRIQRLSVYTPAVCSERRMTFFSVLSTFILFLEPY